MDFYLKDERRKQEEMEMQLDMHLAQEAAHAKMARDLRFDVSEKKTMHLDLKTKERKKGNYSLVS